jgi:hypothetical protein
MIADQERAKSSTRRHGDRRQRRIGPVNGFPRFFTLLGIEFVEKVSHVRSSSECLGGKNEEIADIAVIARHRAISEKSDESA